MENIHSIFTDLKYCLTHKEEFTSLEMYKASMEFYYEESFHKMMDLFWSGDIPLSKAEELYWHLGALTKKYLGYVPH